MAEEKHPAQVAFEAWILRMVWAAPNYQINQRSVTWDQLPAVLQQVWYEVINETDKALRKWWDRELKQEESDPDVFTVDESICEPEPDRYRKHAPSYILIASDGIAVFVLDSIGPMCDQMHDDTVGHIESQYDVPDPGIYIIEPLFTGPDYNGECDSHLDPEPLTEAQRTAYLEYGEPWAPYTDKDGKSWYKKDA